MLKKIFVMLMVLVSSLCFIGCNNDIKKSTEDKQVTSESTKKEDVAVKEITEEEKIENAKVLVVERVGMDPDQGKIEYIDTNGRQKDNENLKKYINDYYMFNIVINIGNGNYEESEVICAVKKGTSDIYAISPIWIKHYDEAYSKEN